MCGRGVSRPLLTLTLTLALALALALTRLVAGVVWRMRGRRGRARGATHRRHALRRASLDVWSAYVKAKAEEGTPHKRSRVARRRLWTGWTG